VHKGGLRGLQIRPLAVPRGLSLALRLGLAPLWPTGGGSRAAWWRAWQPKRTRRLDTGTVGDAAFVERFGDVRARLGGHREAVSAPVPGPAGTPWPRCAACTRSAGPCTRGTQHPSSLFLCQWEEREGEAREEEHGGQVRRIERCKGECQGKLEREKGSGGQERREQGRRGGGQGEQVRSKGDTVGRKLRSLRVLFMGKGQAPAHPPPPLPLPSLQSLP